MTQIAALASLRRPFNSPSQFENLCFRGVETWTSSRVSYLSHDVSLTASVTVLLQIARVTHGSSAVCHLAGRVADRQAALEVHRQLRQALWDGIVINDKTEY